MWELIFLMVIMKIPIAYLCFVVYWAIKSEPRPEAGAAVHAVIDPAAGPGPSRVRHLRRPRPFRGGPHGAPLRTYARAARVVARGEARR